MSTSSTDPLDERQLREIGRSRRAHGVRGDLSVDLLTDRTERLAKGAAVQLRGVWYTVAAARPAGQHWLVHFEGIDDRNAAEALGGAVLYAEALPEPADSDALYVHDLIGAQVVEQDGTDRGRCVSVLANPAHDILELESGALVPVVFVVERRDGALIIAPPDGLFD
jgi:16S rRNA processing protein RimM